jgi:hypothetical protein
LRKITAVSNQGGSIVYVTTIATLEEVISECNIQEIISTSNWYRSSSISADLDAILFDNDGNRTATTDDQIKVNGHVELSPKLIFEIKKKKGGALALDYLKLGCNFEWTKSIQFEASVTRNAFNEPDVTLGKFTGVTFLVLGWIPVKPEVSLLVGAQGSIAANMSFSASETTNTSYYKEYKDGAMQPMKFEKTTTGLNPSFSITGTAEADVYMKTKFTAKVFESIGVYSTGKVYLNGKVEYSTNQNNQIDYCLKTGLKAGVGIEADVFGTNLGSAEVEVKLWELPLPKTGSFDPCGTLTSQVPTNGLVAYYPFNGNANDESGNNNHGTVKVV